MKGLLPLLHKIGIVNDGKMKTRANRNNEQHGGQELPGVYFVLCKGPEGRIKLSEKIFVK